jgi:hypothetical protein
MKHFSFGSWRLFAKDIQHWCAMTAAAAPSLAGKDTVFVDHLPTGRRRKPK